MVTKDKEAQFYVLRKTRCPAILIENFFMTNYRECKLLMNEEFQNRIVDCHFKSILEIEEMDIKQQIEELKTKLTGELLKDLEIRDKMHQLEMKLNNVKPTDSHFECVGCGS